MATHGPLPFARAEYETRIANVRAELTQRKLDLLLVSSPENIFYLSGYGTKGVFAFQMLAVPADGELVFVTRRIEAGNVELVLGDSEIREYATYGDTDSPGKAVIDLLVHRGLTRGRIGVEKQNWFLTVSRLEELASGLPEAEFVDATSVVEDLRLIKSPAELAYLRQAAAISDQAATDGIDAVRAGAQDNDVAIAVICSLIRHGSEYVATWPNIKTGWRTGLAHTAWSNMTIAPGDAVTMEFAGVVRRYHAPVYRTVFAGDPGPDTRRRASALRAANDAGIAALRPGLTAGEIDRIQRSIIDEAGLGQYMGHRTGYSVGIGFPPTWAQTFGLNIMPGSDVLLQPGMVFHMALYIFEPARWGMGLSQSVTITETGHELLTTTDKGPTYTD
jgi:Xaa-Pro dipeptidase